MNAVNWIVQLMLTKLLVGENTIPTDQMIRYPAVSGASKYTFSIWAIAEDRYSEALLDYFRFAQDYYKKNHWRPNMLHVGYRILQDQARCSPTPMTATCSRSIPYRPASPAGWSSLLPTTSFAARVAAGRSSTRHPG